ncbi:MAG: hypothetical protein AAF657_13220 [Acidobacteriota bacterium]
MQPKNKTFRVDLGINLHVAPVPQTNPNMRIFPLQNALLDLTDGEDRAKPAWYAHLGIGDTISFRVADISHRRSPETETTYPDLVVAEFYFTNPTTGASDNPFTTQVIDWRFSERLEDCPSPAYCLDDSVLLPTWDLIAYDAAGEPIETLQFADVTQSESGDGYRAFELTVAIKMVRDGWVDHYVFDPEMIVSDTDNEGPGGGGKKR